MPDRWSEKTGFPVGVDPDREPALSFLVRDGVLWSVRRWPGCQAERPIERGETEMPKYPHVKVRLVGGDGNAFAILGAVERELRRAGVAREEVEEFRRAATSGDHDQLLRVVMETVEVE